MQLEPDARRAMRLDVTDNVSLRNRNDLAPRPASSTAAARALRAASEKEQEHGQVLKYKKLPLQDLTTVSPA